MQRYLVRYKHEMQRVNRKLGWTGTVSEIGRLSQLTLADRLKEVSIDEVLLHFS